MLNETNLETYNFERLERIKNEIHNRGLKDFNKADILSKNISKNNENEHTLLKCEEKILNEKLNSVSIYMSKNNKYFNDKIIKLEKDVSSLFDSYDLLKQKSNRFKKEEELLIKNIEIHFENICDRFSEENNNLLERVKLKIDKNFEFFNKEIYSNSIISKREMKKLRDNLDSQIPLLKIDFYEKNNALKDQHLKIKNLFNSLLSNAEKNVNDFKNSRVNFFLLLETEIRSIAKRSRTVIKSHKDSRKLFETHVKYNVDRIINNLYL